MAIDISQGIKHKSNTISNFLRAFSQSPKVGEYMLQDSHYKKRKRFKKRKNNKRSLEA
jgi:hypothetical protein